MLGENATKSLWWWCLVTASNYFKKCLMSMTVCSYNISSFWDEVTCQCWTFLLWSHGYWCIHIVATKQGIHSFQIYHFLKSPPCFTKDILKLTCELWIFWTYEWGHGSVTWFTFDLCDTWAFPNMLKLIKWLLLYSKVVFWCEMEKSSVGVISTFTTIH